MAVEDSPNVLKSGKVKLRTKNRNSLLGQIPKIGLLIEFPGNNMQSAAQSFSYCN
jgi:hypothetical protein